MHTLTHPHTRTHTHAPTHTHPHSKAHTQMHTHIKKHTSPHINNIRTQMHTHSQHSHAHPYTTIKCTSIHPNSSLTHKHSHWYTNALPFPLTLQLSNSLCLSFFLRHSRSPSVANPDKLVPRMHNRLIFDSSPTFSGHSLLDFCTGCFVR